MAVLLGLQVLGVLCWKYRSAPHPHAYLNLSALALIPTLSALSVASPSAFSPQLSTQSVMGAPPVSQLHMHHSPYGSVHFTVATVGTMR